MYYSDIYNYDIELYEFITKKYGTGEEAWHLFHNSYIDPDQYASEPGLTKKHSIKCTFDGLLSIKRIHYYEGFGDNFIETFKMYRKKPVISFPCEQGGINQSRARLLEDRIDHTLLDLKNYCEGKDCVLSEAYKKDKTLKWINSFDSRFERIVDWMGIKGSFVNEKYEVFDLEKTGDIPLKCLKQEYIALQKRNDYISAWSDVYYKNLKNKLDLLTRDC